MFDIFCSVNMIYDMDQGRSSRLKSGGAQGGTIFSSNFLLHFWAIWKNDPFSKSEKVPGLKPRLPRLVRRPCPNQNVVTYLAFNA